MRWMTWQGQADYWAARTATPLVFGARARDMTLRGARQIMKLHKELIPLLQNDEPDMSAQCRYLIFCAGASGFEIPACAKTEYQSHKNLEARWQWFLTLPAGSPDQLSAANHNLIAQYILAALQDLSYNSVSFDVIEDPQRKTQTVSASDVTDDVNGTAVKIRQILLQITGPIPQGSVLPRGLLPLDGPPILILMFVSESIRVRMAIP